MIAVAFIVGAAIVAAGAIAKYWDRVRSWLIRGIEAVSKIIEGVVYGVKVFVKKTVEAYKEISRHYSQDQQGKWKETIVSREIDPQEVPAEILRKASFNKEKDITEELELVLS